MFSLMRHTGGKSTDMTFYFNTKVFSGTKWLIYLKQSSMNKCIENCLLWKNQAKFVRKLKNNIQPVYIELSLKINLFIP